MLPGLHLPLLHSRSSSGSGTAVTQITYRPSSSTPYAAYALRSLYGATKLVRVRNASNVEADIYAMLDGSLNTAALLTHCGSGNGYVTKWYDQSGNGRDLVQTTTTWQPMIVSAGAVITQNGKPTIKFSTDQATSPVPRLTSAYGWANLPGWTVMASLTETVKDWNSWLSNYPNVALGWGSPSSGVPYLMELHRSGSADTASNLKPVDGSCRIETFTSAAGLSSSGGTLTVMPYLNGTGGSGAIAVSFYGAPTNNMVLGSQYDISGSAPRDRLNGNVHELLIWNSVLTDRYVAEKNIGSYYSTTTSPGAHKYWRLYYTGAPDNGTTTYVGELQFRTTAGTAESPQPPSGTAICGDWDSGVTVAANAFNGTPYDYWSLSNSGWLTGKAWIGFNYTTARTVTEVYVQAANNAFAAGAPRNFRIDYSDDGTNWFAVGNYTTPSWASIEARTFTI